VGTEVDVPLPGRQPLLADPGQRDHDLDITGTVTQYRETQLAADPGQHHPPGDARHLTGERVRPQIAVPRVQLRGGCGALKADRIGFGAGGKQPFSLAEADLDLLRHVLIGHPRRVPAKTQPEGAGTHVPGPGLSGRTGRGAGPG
jgi:hypothetical protein